jgi:5'-3' exonuclease
MGINGFNKFLRDTCPEVFEEVHISEYGFKRVAIDISLYLHKFKAVCGDRWLSAFINLIACLRRNEIHCVFIFDGKAPVEKERERAKRREEREKMEKQLYILEEAYDEYNKTGVVAKCLKELYERRRSPKRLLGSKSETIDMEWIDNKIQQKRNQLYDIAPVDFEYAKKLFEILQVPYYTASWEAEKTCAKLCRDGKVDAVLSEDTDVMAYGAPVFLTKIDTGRNTCVRICYPKLLESLSLERNQFLDLCIMCGTDYNSNIPRVGSKTAYKYILQHGGIDEIKSGTSLDTSVLNHNRVRQLFSEFEDDGISNIPYCGRPNFELLEKFLITHQIQLDIDRLRQDFVSNMVIFEDSEDEESILATVNNDEEIILSDEE